MGYTGAYTGPHTHIQHKRKNSTSGYTGAQTRPFIKNWRYGKGETTLSIKQQI
jgi:hypothetical protein